MTSGRRVVSDWTSQVYYTADVFGLLKPVSTNASNTQTIPSTFTSILSKDTRDLLQGPDVIGGVDILDCIYFILCQIVDQQRVHMILLWTNIRRLDYLSSLSIPPCFLFLLCVTIVFMHEFVWIVIRT